jgi:hypothetical protein
MTPATNGENSTPAHTRFARLEGNQAIERAESDLAEGKALGWFQGRKELGPRALGNHSIIAPAVLREDLSEWFVLDVESPYMLLVADVAERRRRAITAERQPLFSTCTMPLMTRRSSTRSTPRTSVGRRGSIRFHCSSLSQNRFFRIQKRIRIVLSERKN